MNSEVVELNTADITVKRSLRKDMGDLGPLEKSIRKFGLLCPLIVDYNHVLISGSRRLEACRRAGIASVRAVKIDTTYDSMTALDILSDDNLCRRAFAADEVEKLIQLKKSILTGKAPSAAGVFKRLRNVLSRS